ncbi:2-succinyl-5-enolpyruvyl-6-hydroxy-3-cyclohexene-1-carboxylic-acid synthase [Fructilactobacillus carniphilus]|uniref:2-succinyl-5-enolpyruvyl-6-hydroxy-3-cyclohexene-1-carboxylate synthase n=1 Tax=Fructilactobacillus carniphilus TaxID=2940297 RepID=A0ABY5BXJ6_9LACO|nr:2-succinyl-5-enolpyruvyl-6-hydroxy-3-cyclohexene-1-carboxylic-acid synthase [Fructilactobacillus carniphilus]USS90524.1 2-succinyl-5-enolpyruvyl-6-hydroxy-3-cyclohexene-1-carboxylic-acid synthase [Fructilactobacillus carniphilus]
MTNVMTNNLKHLISACENQGVTNFVLSPGSRNTPLALLLAERNVNLTVAVDERSAGFFALGLAKASRQPVALVATSGTATANYAPAIAEAHSFHVPLVVLTTDRPQELQEIGAPQTIPQAGMYTTNVKQALTINVQEESPDVTEYIDYQVQQLVRQTKLAPRGPVQINLPLRKPLLPELGTPWPVVVQQDFGHITAQLDAASLAQLTQRLEHKRCLITIGPTDHPLPMQLLQEVADQLDAPIIADVLSSVRGSASTVPVQQLLKLPEQLQPEIVLRFGGTPVSASLLPWLKQQHVPVIQIGADYLGKDHSRWAYTSYNLSATDFLQQLATTDIQGTAHYRADWEHSFQPTLAADQKQLTAQELPRLLSHLTPEHQLFLANSLTVRNFDQAFAPAHPVQVHGNRGANGIDGTISSAVGMANQQSTWLVTGDLAFFHDLTGLQLARQTNAHLTIVVVNNDGGGIFSLLPQAEAPYFEQLFGTPQALNLKAAAAFVNAQYHQVTTVSAFQRLVQEPWEGLRIIEVPANRAHLSAEYPEGLA